MYEGEFPVLEVGGQPHEGLLLHAARLHEADNDLVAARRREHVAREGLTAGTSRAAAFFFRAT